MPTLCLHSSLLCPLHLAPFLCCLPQWILSSLPKGQVRPPTFSQSQPGPDLVWGGGGGLNRRMLIHVWNEWKLERRTFHPQAELCGRVWLGSLLVSVNQESCVRRPRVLVSQFRSRKCKESTKAQRPSGSPQKTSLQLQAMLSLPSRTYPGITRTCGPYQDLGNV